MKWERERKKKKPNPVYQERSCSIMGPTERERHIRELSAERWNGGKPNTELGFLEGVHLYDLLIKKKVEK